MVPAFTYLSSTTTLASPACQRSSAGRVLAKRAYRFLDALELMRRSEQIADAEPHHRVLGADRLEPGDGEFDLIGMTAANEVAQHLGCSKVDFDNPGGLQDDQPRRLRRGSQGIPDVAPEMIGVEKRQRRLKSRDNDTRFALASESRARRPPDRRARHPFEYQHPGAGRAPYAVQERERNPDTDALLDRQNDNGCR